MIGRASAPLILCLGAAGLGAGLAVAAYVASTEDVAHADRWAALVLVANTSFVACGVLAWIRRPDNWIGPLMVATGVALVTRPVWPVATSSGLYTVTLALQLVGFALFVHLLLAFPEGRLHSRLERVLVTAAYATAIVVQLAMLVVMNDQLGRNLLLVVDSPRIHDFLMTNQERFIVIVLAGALAVLVWRWVGASRPFRRAIEPVLAMGGVSISLLAATLILQESDPAQAVTVSEIAYGSLALVPLGFVAGLMRVRLARGGIGKLVLELGETTGPNRLRDALARALGDPSLEVAYAMTDGAGYVDSDGRRVDLSAATGRAVTQIERGGRPAAALVHDPALAEYPGLVERSTTSGYRLSSAHSWRR